MTVRALILRLEGDIRDSNQRPLASGRDREEIAARARFAILCPTGVAELAALKCIEKTNIDLEVAVERLVDGEKVVGLTSNVAFEEFERRYHVRRDPSNDPTVIFRHEHHGLRNLLGRDAVDDPLTSNLARDLREVSMEASEPASGGGS